jgi:hypothetical protein
MNNETFDFNLFLKESKESLLNPKSYFSTLKTTGGIIEPLIKAVIYGTVAGILFFLWDLLHMRGFGSGLLGASVGFRLLITTIIGSGIGLFVGAVILLIISSICKGNTDFEANLRVTAAVMVVMPIFAFLSFFSGINIYLGMVISLVVFIYGLWLFYNALIESLKCNQESAKIVMYVFIALIVLILLFGMRNTNRYGRLNRDAQKFLKEINKD